RHTRAKRDWSSDVCSSDLHAEDTQVMVIGMMNPHANPQMPVAMASIHAWPSHGVTTRGIEPAAIMATSTRSRFTRANAHGIRARDTTAMADRDRVLVAIIAAGSIPLVDRKSTHLH